LLSVSVVEVAPIDVGEAGSARSLDLPLHGRRRGTAGSGVNVTVLPAVVALFVGWVVTTGATEEMGVAVASALFALSPAAFTAVTL